MWSQYSQWFFIDVAAAADPTKTTPYFVVRPFWNKRLAINARTGEHVELGAYRAATSNADLAGAPDDVRRIMLAAIAEEARRSLAALAAAPDSLRNDKEYTAFQELSCALHSVGFLKLATAEDHLRRLEAGLDESLDHGHDLHAMVRQSLRALGKTPAPGFGVALYPYVNHEYYRAPDREHPYTTHVALEARAANAKKIVVGMGIKELTDLIGCPDAEVRWNPVFAFDYDIDAPTQYTLRVTFDQAQLVVTKVDVIVPFAFLHDVPRMVAR
jgi:hypothetical protein